MYNCHYQFGVSNGYLFEGAQPHTLCFPLRHYVCLAALKSVKPSLTVSVGTSRYVGAFCIRVVDL